MGDKVGAGHLYGVSGKRKGFGFLFNSSKKAFGTFIKSFVEKKLTYNNLLTFKMCTLMSFEVPVSR